MTHSKIVRASALALALAVPLAISPMLATPAAAQWTVFDPSNYAQNVLQAARTATAIDMAREDEPSAPPAAPTIQPSIDPLRAEQRRCQRLGEAAANDAECKAVWAETRDRFLSRSGERVR